MSTPYTDAALKAELAADPLKIGYASPLAARDYPMVANLINAPSQVAYQPIPTTSVLVWGAQTGLRAAIQTATTTGSAQSIALAVLDLLQGGYAFLDVTNPAIVGTVASGIPYTPGAGTVTTAGLLDGLVNASVMTAAQKDQLISIGKTSVSRAFALWGNTAPILDGDRIMAVFRS